jgi:hypothetical protein
MSDDHEFRATTDKMLDLIDRLREIEVGKQNAEFASPEFVALADESEKLGRLVFRWAQLQAQMAHATPKSDGRGPHGVRLADIEPRPLDRILADWREAQLRLEIARPGSPDAAQAADSVESLREEYHATRERKQS